MRHARELTQFLNFEDVQDFGGSEFVEKNFSSVSGNAYSSFQSSQVGSDDESGTTGMVMTELARQETQLDHNSLQLLKRDSGKALSVVPIGSSGSPHKAKSVQKPQLPFAD